MAPAIIRRPGEGSINRAFGLPRRFLVRTQDTGGALTVFEEEVPPGAGPPLHVHRREHETFVVLEGTVRFRCDDEETVLGEGGVIVIPPGSPHAFKNEGSANARLLISCTPGGVEGFFETIEAEALEPPGDMPRIAEIAEAHGMEILGPPL